MKYVLLILLFVGALAGRLVYLVETFDGDSAMFIYMGRVVSEGGVVGREVIDNKLPTVGLVMAPLWRAFGLSWTPYVLLGACLSIGGALILSRAAGRSFGPTATLPALLFALVYLNFNEAVYAGFQLETFHCFFAILAAAAALQWFKSGGGVRDAFVVGLCAGTAALFKPSGLAVLGAFVVYAIAMGQRTWQQRTASIVAAGLGMLTVGAVAIWYLVLNGAQHETMQSLKQVGDYARGSVWSFADGYKLVIVASIVAFPFLLRVRYVGVLLGKLRYLSAAEAVPASFAMSWLVCECLGVMMQGRMYAYHFLVMAPPAALVFGLAGRRSRPIAIVAVLSPILLLSLLASWKVWQSRDAWPARLAVSDYLIERTTRTDAVWKDDAPRVWLETGCRPGSAIPMSFLFANDDAAPATFSQRLLADFRFRKPKYIVLPADRERFVKTQGDAILELSSNPVRRKGAADAWKDIFHYVDANYLWEAQVDREIVYRRIDE